MTPLPSMTWHWCRLLSGHGVASGEANIDPRRETSPYPRGTIAMQTPFFAKAGLDLKGMWPGTLNLSVEPLKLSLKSPDFHFPLLYWTDLHPPETFSFWCIMLRCSPQSFSYPAFVYFPHPETKAMHWQPPGVVEVLAPWIDGLVPNAPLQIGVDPERISVFADQGGVSTDR